MIARGLAVLVAVAACSKGPQSAAQAAALKDAAEPAAKPEPKGPTMSDDAVIKGYYKQHGWGEPERIKPTPHVPGLYDVDGESRVLVYQGKIVDGGQLPALAGYVRATKLALKPPLDAGELVELVGAFDAYPDISGYSRQGYYMNGPLTDLNPRITFDDRGAHLVLSYLLQSATEPTATPHLVRLARWTLDIGNDGKLAWRGEETKYDASKQH